MLVYRAVCQNLPGEVLCSTHLHAVLRAAAWNGGCGCYCSSLEVPEAQRCWHQNGVKQWSYQSYSHIQRLEYRFIVLILNIPKYHENLLDFIFQTCPKPFSARKKTLGPPEPMPRAGPWTCRPGASGFKFHNFPKRNYPIMILEWYQNWYWNDIRIDIWMILGLILEWYLDWY